MCAGALGLALSLVLVGAAAGETAAGGGAPAALLIRIARGTVVQLALVGIVALPLQLLVPAIRRRPKIATYEFWLDLLYAFQGVWLTAISFSAAVAWTVDAVYGGSGPWFPALRQLPYWAQVVLAVWAFDFIVYWRHRMEHTFSVLWSVHAVHHTAENVDFLTTTRLHPLELAAGALCNAAIVRLGLEPSASTLGFTIYVLYNYFIHINVRLRYRGPLKYVLVSPFLHQWHHAKDEAAVGRNVGVVFAWNDRLFGTVYDPEHWPTEFGIAVPPPERVGQSYLRQLLYPLQYLSARMAARRVATVS